MAGDNTGAPTIDLLSQNVVLKAGMQVVTSGDGGLLPPGLAIGTVVADPSGGFRVVLLADAASSEDVNVVDFKLKAEAPPAVTPGDLPATAAGLPPAAPPPPLVTPTTVPATTPPGAPVVNRAAAPGPVPAATAPAAHTATGATPKPTTPAPDATPDGNE